MATAECSTTCGTRRGAPSLHSGHERFGPSTARHRPAPFGIRESDPTGNGCLVRLNGVQDLSVTATACVPGGLKVGSLRGLLAPDGRHLVEGLDDKIQIFDLNTVTTTKAALRTCPGDRPKAWEDNNTVLVENSTTEVVTRCFVDDSAPLGGVRAQDGNAADRVGAGPPHQLSRLHSTVPIPCYVSWVAEGGSAGAAIG